MVKKQKEHKITLQFKYVGHNWYECVKSIYDNTEITPKGDYGFETYKDSCICEHKLDEFFVINRRSTIYVSLTDKPHPQYAYPIRVSNTESSAERIFIKDTSMVKLPWQLRLIIAFRRKFGASFIYVELNG